MVGLSVSPLSQYLLSNWLLMSQSACVCVFFRAYDKQAERKTACIRVTVEGGCSGDLKHLSNRLEHLKA